MSEVNKKRAASYLLPDPGGEVVRDLLAEIELLDQRIEELVFRPEVKWFAEQMEETLRRNDHKGGWSDCSFKWLVKRIYQEIGEMKRAPTLTRRVFEATDIANFAMMIADNAKAENERGEG